MNPAVATNAAETPKQAAEQFWRDVLGLLTGEKYRHAHQVAQGGINTYKQDVLRKRNVQAIPDAVFNQGEERTAEAVDRVIRSGLPDLG